MPAIFFGRPLSNRGNSVLSVSTDAGDLEPCTPSDFKIYARPHFISTVLSILSRVLGHLIVVLSYPIHSFIPFQAAGENYLPPDNLIPFFPRPGFGFSLLRGETITEKAAGLLEKAEFRSLAFGKSIVWIKDNADKSDYLLVSDNVEHINNVSRIPDRYMNPASFKAYLTLLAFTVRVCETFHRLCEPCTESMSVDEAIERSTITGWRNIVSSAGDLDTLIFDQANSSAVFTKQGTYKWVSTDHPIISTVVIAVGGSGISPANSLALSNPYTENKEGFISAGHPNQIIAHGKLLKFNPKLALPDANLIGDVIGRRFLSALGPDFETQSENLQFLKSGLSALRLQHIGDVFAHLYKCLDVAIECQSGCVPYFSGRIYEGCVVMGGPGASFTINGQSSDFETLEDLKAEFSVASSHAKALNDILSSCNLPVIDSAALDTPYTCIFDLRAKLIDIPMTPDARDFILQQATRIDFGEEPWVISPINIKKAMDLISTPSILSNKYPIGRLCLFSKDPVRLALSCFGETSCPSWMIPNGTKVSLQSALPPIVPAKIQIDNSNKGATSDATWVMPIRKTDLLSAEDEFRRMADDGCYRSISTSLAKKSGMRVFSRDKMIVFWGSMQTALSRVNPSVKYGEEHIPGKRKAVDSGSSLGKPAPKKRTLGF